MSNPHIRTKWQHVLPLIEADEVYLTAPKDGKALHWSEFNANPAVLKEFVKDLSELPRFCIDRELIELAQRDEYIHSLLDMKKAGVLRLPFPAMMVEYEHATSYDSRAHSICLLRDSQYDGFFPWETPPADGKTRFELFEMADVEGGADFYGVRFSVEKDDQGHYLTMGPSVVACGIHEREGKPWLHLGGEASALIPPSAALAKHVELTYRKDAGNIVYAAAAGYLLMASAGVHKEVITCERMNRKRVANGKVPIPRHTYVYIGRVYRTDKSELTDAYIPRRSPRPHWRRGHLKNVRFGEGRLQTKPVFIPGRIVSYRGEMPKAPQYIVSE